MRPVPDEHIIESGSIGIGSPEIIETVPRSVPDFSVEEAIILMEDQEEHFLLFNNKESGKLNLVYKRSDGHYGVVDTSG